MEASRDVVEISFGGRKDSSQLLLDNPPPNTIWATSNLFSVLEEVGVVAPKVVVGVAGMSTVAPFGAVPWEGKVPCPLPLARQPKAKSVA